MRLIDADSLTKRLQHLWNIHDDVDFNNKDVWNELENAPTIDAVEVVRCKYCEHDKYCCRIIRSSGRLESDFCSYGERKTDG